MIHNIADLAAYCGSDVSSLKKDVYKYTSCGAWIEWDANAVYIGSIVEGADAEVPTHELRFPFSENDWDGTVQDVEDMADEIWHMWNDDA